MADRILEKARFEHCTVDCWVKVLSGDELKSFFGSTSIPWGITHCALEVYPSDEYAQYVLFDHMPTDREIIDAMASPQETDYDRVLQWLCQC